MIAGQQVTATLRLSHLLGQGAMGSVWVADHRALGTQVAVKFMSPVFAYDPELVERFRREAMAAAQIKSPHVAQVFDHGVTEENEPYIVMELLDGESLRSRMNRLGALRPAEVARIVAHVARALGRAHHLGIVHRDIKPENLFVLDVGGEPFVKVLDFGIAKQPAGLEPGMTLAGSILGTPSYMSPEQLLSAKNVDLGADLWALAVVAYEALTGHLPFKGETLGAVSVTVNAGVFLAPSALRPELSPAIDVWMWRALRRDPATRFASAKEMANALDQAISGSARPSMPSEQDLAMTPEPAAERVSQQSWQEITVVQAASKPPPPESGLAPTHASPSGRQGRTLAGMVSTSSSLRRPTAWLTAAAILACAVVATGVGMTQWRAGSEVASAPEVPLTSERSVSVAAAGEPKVVTAAPEVPAPPLHPSPDVVPIAPTAASARAIRAATARVQHVKDTAPVSSSATPKAADAETRADGRAAPMPLPVTPGF